MLTDVGTEELAHLEMICAIIHQLTRNLSPEEIKKQGFAEYYVDHTLGVWPQAAGGVPFSSTFFQSKGDPITDLHEDMAAEQKARTTYDNILRLTDDPDVLDPIRFLRQREIVHFQRFGETLRIVQDHLDSRNFYAHNPAFDRGYQTAFGESCSNHCDDHDDPCNNRYSGSDCDNNCGNHNNPYNNHRSDSDCDNNCGDHNNPYNNHRSGSDCDNNCGNHNNPYNNRRSGPDCDNNCSKHNAPYNNRHSDPDCDNNCGKHDASYGNRRSNCENKCASTHTAYNGNTGRIIKNN